MHPGLRAPGPSLLLVRAYHLQGLPRDWPDAELSSNRFPTNGRIYRLGVSAIWFSVYQTDHQYCGINIVAACHELKCHIFRLHTFNLSICQIEETSV